MYPYHVHFHVYLLSKSTVAYVPFNSLGLFSHYQSDRESAGPLHNYTLPTRCSRHVFFFSRSALMLNVTWAENREGKGGKMKLGNPYSWRERRRRKKIGTASREKKNSQRWKRKGLEEMRKSVDVGKKDVGNKWESQERKMGRRNCKNCFRRTTHRSRTVTVAWGMRSCISSSKGIQLPEKKKNGARWVYLLQYPFEFRSTV